MDWALIESWKEMGVPLHVALRGIEHAFDSYEAKPRRRSVKTLMYCQEEVEARYAEWLESQLGASPENRNGERANAEDADAHLPFPRAAILAHLSNAHETLGHLCEERNEAEAGSFCEDLARVISRLQSLEKDFAQAARPNAESLEESLTNLEKMLDETLLAALSPKDLAAAKDQTAAQLEPYRKRMEAATYQQTYDNLLLKRLRERIGVPRLSLFYL